MSRAVINLGNVYKSYKKWVASNPQTVGDFETTLKWASYFVAGRVTNSVLATELIYALSNLLCLLNDRILAEDYVRQKNIISEADGSTVRLKMFLTTLEYCEVFIELSGQRIWGTKGRWFLIVVVQMIKCIGRLVLVLQKREKVVRSPPIPVLDRMNLEKNFTREEPVKEAFQEESTCRLKRTGKVLRKIEGSPPLHLRNWKPLIASTIINTDNRSRALTSAELFYILKPIVHLGGIKVFGYNDWKSWTLALMMDFISIRTYYSNRQDMTKEEKVELSKRCLCLAMYLMRSPFFDKFTGRKIDSLLAFLSRNIPLARYACKPIAQYIPFWQQTYFYVWST